jgi:hypothetical protein
MVRKVTTNASGNKAMQMLFGRDQRPASLMASPSLPSATVCALVDVLLCV